MRIDKILLRQVGPFEDATIELPPGDDPELADVYLLTGPNGSGKSTALYALAGLFGTGFNQLGPDFSAPRFRSAESLAATKWDRGSLASSRQLIDGNQESLTDPFGWEVEMKRIQVAPDQGMVYFNGRKDGPFYRYSFLASQFRFDSPHERFSWAVFAYAGMRDISHVQVKSIQEPKLDPFWNSLSFTNTADTENLAQWVANQDFKRLKAKEAGKAERAEQLAKSIRDIESIVAEIVGENFAFDTSDEDNNVRIRLNGSVVDLGLLPDGLKSIVSWVADLLMRLDRIPWVEDTPTLERTFLLLLDEVDIHLHPAWQRKVLPIVQRMFPNAQIIASTHSPFVVVSAEDAHIVTLKLEHGVSSVEQVAPSQAGVSYSAVLRSIFGIDSEFDLETEQTFQRFHQAKRALLSGEAKDRAQVDELADQLGQRSEEVKELVAIELRQLERQLKSAAGK